MGKTSRDAGKLQKNLKEMREKTLCKNLTSCGHFCWNWFNWMLWRMKKKKKITQKCYGFVHIGRNDPCQWLFFSWTYLPWKFHLMRLNMNHFTFHCFITFVVGGFFVRLLSSWFLSLRPPVNVWNAWKMHSGKYLDGSNSPRNVFRLFFSSDFCWIFNPVKVASVQHRSRMQH